MCAGEQESVIQRSNIDEATVTVVVNPRSLNKENESTGKKVWKEWVQNY